MTELLKRLEIIKSSIVIDDEEIIELQIMKLNQLDIDEEVKSIISKLENQEYSSVISDIEHYLNRYSGVVEYVDTEIATLKLELKSLENQLQELATKKAECINDLEEFNTLYNLHLGDLIESILNLKREMLYKQTIKSRQKKAKYKEDLHSHNEIKATIDDIKSTITELEDLLEKIDEDDESYDENHQEYKELQEKLKKIDDEFYDETYQEYKELQEELEKLEAELREREEELSKIQEDIKDDEIFEQYEHINQEYEQFHKNYEEIKQTQADLLEMSEDEKQELKKLWKQACKLCHPDIVADEFSEKATQIMQALNEAYSKRDLAKVREILASLENKTSFEVQSDSIVDKKILKARIREYKEMIFNLESEIDDIELDETYQTILEIDDMDEYFEGMKKSLEDEKERLEKEASEILEEKTDEVILEATSAEQVKDWIKILWNWADASGIPNTKLSRKKEYLLATTVLDLTDIKLSHLPKEIVKLENLKELILWDCGIRYLPSDIIKLENLKKLNLRGNPDLAITTNQKAWLEKLEKNAKVFKDKIGHIEHDVLARLEQESSIEDNINTSDKQAETICMEQTRYAAHIQSIENIRFERIRRYCENLAKSNDADEMQKDLGENGKMKKALIYDALEQFIDKLDGETITLVDWGCDQGIGCMLVLDYIKEKQLDVVVDQIFLIDNDRDALARALAQVDSLKQNEVGMIALDSDDGVERLNEVKNSITINLVVNDNMPADLEDVDFGCLNQAYFVALSNDSEEFIEEIYADICSFADTQDISIRDGKIGKFDRFERIFLKKK